MKNNNFSQLSVRLFTILTITVAVAIAVAAQTRGVTKASILLAPRCSVRSISGNYGMTVTASNLIAPGTSIPIVAVGLVNFDGDGRLTGIATTSFGGNVGSDSVTGTYTVESNCTGTFSVTFSNGFTINHNLVVVDEGKEIIFIQTDQGTVTTGRFRRQ
jgi:hypothetical protein